MTVAGRNVIVEQFRVNNLFKCLSLASATCQELSQELGTSREVISLLLKKLEQQECILLKRVQILLGGNKTMSDAYSKIN